MLICDRPARRRFRANRDFRNEEEQKGQDKFGKVFRHGPIAFFHEERTSAFRATWTCESGLTRLRLSSVVIGYIIVAASALLAAFSYLIIFGEI